MLILMDEEICGFTLAESNQARKIVSKKKMKEIPKLKELFYSKAKSEAVANYVWEYVVSPQLSYSFSVIHAISYSIIGYQTAYLATHWNPIYWNTSTLIVNSGSLEDTIDGQTNYAKIAKALGTITSNNIKVSPVNINSSGYSFKPDAANNRILYAMNALNKVGGDVINEIIAKRPYTGINDFMARCPVNKAVMISLIKAGAFDELDSGWASKISPEEPRIGIMAYYLYKTDDMKKRLTLQNLSMLIQRQLLPDSLSIEQEIFAFNKRLKSNGYVIDAADLGFYEKNFSGDELIIEDGKIVLPQRQWERLYKKKMDAIRDWLAENQEEVLKRFNQMLFQDAWDKYAAGSVAAWEMESMCYYYHEHELKYVNTAKYGISNYSKLPSKPRIETYFVRSGRQIPIYATTKIIGTVLGKNAIRSTVSILTISGVVEVKFTKEYFSNYDRQLSEIQSDGTKKIIDKSWFTRGTLIMVTGYRIDDTFRAKAYKRTQSHQLYKIIKVTDAGANIVLQHERSGVE